MADNYLYVCNTTKQNHIFAFHAPSIQDELKETDRFELDGKTKIKQRIFKTGIRYQDIPAGTQIRVGNKEMDRADALLIVKQHIGYGIREVSELKNERDFIGLIWCYGKPIQFDAITGTMLGNDNFLDEQSHEIREQTSAAVAQQIQRTMQDCGVDVPRVEVSMVEEPKARGAKPSIDEGYEIVKDGVLPRRASAPSLRNQILEGLVSPFVK